MKKPTHKPTILAFARGLEKGVKMKMPRGNVKHAKEMKEQRKLMALEYINKWLDEVEKSCEVFMIDIASAAGLSETTMRQYLKEMGIEMPKKKHFHNPWTVDELMGIFKVEKNG